MEASVIPRPRHNDGRPDAQRLPNGRRVARSAQLVDKFQDPLNVGIDLENLQAQGLLQSTEGLVARGGRGKAPRSRRSGVEPSLYVLEAHRKVVRNGEP